MNAATLNQTGTTMAGTTRLSVRNIRKSFGTHEVLRGISLEARDGDVISLLGASGSGKSTCLRCINLLEIADHGEISVDGELIQMQQRGGKECPRQSPSGRPDPLRTWHGVPVVQSLVPYDDP